MAAPTRDRSVQERIARIKHEVSSAHHMAFSGPCEGCGIAAAAIDREVVTPLVEAERERAAKIAEELYALRPVSLEIREQDAGIEIARAIRATGGA